MQQVTLTHILFTGSSGECQIVESSLTHPVTVTFPATVVNGEHGHVLTLLVQTGLKEKKQYKHLNVSDDIF